MNVGVGLEETAALPQVGGCDAFDAQSGQLSRNLINERFAIGFGTVTGSVLVVREVAPKQPVAHDQSKVNRTCSPALQGLVRAVELFNQ